MARRGSSARAAALRRAQQAKAARDAAQLSREKDIEAALADYFQATSHAEQLRTEARHKADRLLADAEQAARAPRQAAGSALHRLRELLGNATEVASLCGLTISEVRSLLAADHALRPATDGDATDLAPQPATGGDSNA